MDTSNLTKDVYVSTNQHQFHVAGNDVPDHPFFRDDFQYCLQTASGIAQKAVDECEELLRTIPVAYVRNLCATADSLTRYRPGAEKIIGVLGDSGQGQSSLINSLLHYPELAVVGDAGSACTSVAIEYRYKKGNQMTDYEVEVRKLPKSKVRKVLKQLVWDYRQLYLLIMEEDEGGDDYNACKRASEFALSTLETAFKHHEEFSASAMQRICNEEDEDKFVLQLMTWYKELEWPRRDNDDEATDIAIRRAATIADCNDITGKYMEDKIWPFIKVIRVYLDSTFLKAGLVLVDLPGLKDRNRAREKTTEDYIARCDYVLIVAGISRVITDQSVAAGVETILELTPTHLLQGTQKNRGLAIVCTKMDVITERSVRKKFEKRNLLDLDTMKELDDSVATATRANDRKTASLFKLKLKDILIHTRNNLVKTGLYKVYGDRVPALRIFPVSNKIYENFMDDESEINVDDTGIPELRRSMLQLAGDAQLEVGINYISSGIGKMLRCGLIWAARNSKSIPSSGQEDLLELTKEKEKRSRSCKDKMAIKLYNFPKETVMRFVEKKYDLWQQAALDEEFKWHPKKE